VLFIHKGEQNYVIWKKKDETEDHHAKQNRPDSEKQNHIL
jgi:hypothetical protein